MNASNYTLEISPKTKRKRKPKVDGRLSFPDLKPFDLNTVEGIREAARHLRGCADSFEETAQKLALVQK